MGVAKRHVGLDFPRCYNSSMTNGSNNDYFGVKVVVIGGGTGSFTLLSGLKKYTHSITALVNMVDDGGSTGVLIRVIFAISFLMRRTRFILSELMLIKFVFLVVCGRKTLIFQRASMRTK